MNLEELTKSQIILLTLFVSFVTSIATGIVTVTLVNQAPTDVVRTINTQVERVVEKIVPGETKIVERIREPGPSQTESDLIVAVASEAKHSLVQVSGTDISLRGGFSISSDGLIVTRSNGLFPEGNYAVTFVVYEKATSTPLSAKLVRADYAKGIALLRIVPDINSSDKSGPFSFLTGTNVIKYPFLKLGEGSVSLGERVLVMGVDKAIGPVLRSGSIVGIKQETASSSPVLITNIEDEDVIRAMPMLDLSGTLVGAYIGLVDGQNIAITEDDISSALKIAIVKEAGDVAGASAP